MISTASRVGIGNIAGILALATGGAGALFWMWVMAFLVVPQHLLKVP